jgi:drug/metabolite transporter (DMT)-like permease
MWAAYSLLSAFGISSSDAFAKKAMERGALGPRILLARYMLSVPVLLPFLAAGIPELDRAFWLLHPVWIPLETLAIYLYIHAIRISPLSLTLPFLSLTPVFLIFTGWIVLGEAVGPLGVSGIILVVSGSYIIHIREAGGDLLGPVKAILRERGTRLILIVAFLYSLTSLLGKLLIQHSSPTYFAVHYAVVMSIVMSPAGLGKPAAEASHGSKRHVALSAFFYSMMILFHMLALSACHVVAYMIAMKRFSGTFGVVYGRIFFGEKGFGHRLAGGGIMALGGLLIVWD